MSKNKHRVRDFFHAIGAFFKCFFEMPKSCDRINHIDETFEDLNQKISNMEFRLNLLTTYYLDTTKSLPARGTLRDFQLADVAMLEKAVGVFARQGYVWWLAYGSALGTIRHGGFVPWDDDLDIGMLHRDFLSLLEHRELFEAIGLRLIDWWVPGKMARIVSQSREDVFIDIYAYEHINGWIWPLPPWNDTFYAKKPMPEEVILPCTTEYTFEGVRVHLPHDCQKYLMALYGDYLALPPAPHNEPGHCSVNPRIEFTPPRKPESV